MRPQVRERVMANYRPVASLFEPALYRICIVGYLDTKWSDYCGGMMIEQVSDPKFKTITILIGRLIDQSTRIGVLNSLHDIGCPIVSVEYVAAE
jgi:hypothetical protein